MSANFPGVGNRLPGYDIIIEFTPAKKKKNSPGTCIHCNKSNEYQDDDYECWECKTSPCSKKK